MDEAVALPMGAQSVEADEPEEVKLIGVKLKVGTGPAETAMTRSTLEMAAFLR